MISDGYFIITILKMRKLRPQKVKWFSQGHRASKSQDQDSKQEDSLQSLCFKYLPRERKGKHRIWQTSKDKEGRSNTLKYW